MTALTDIINDNDIKEIYTETCVQEARLELAVMQAGLKDYAIAIDMARDAMKKIVGMDYSLCSDSLRYAKAIAQNWLNCHP